MDTTQREMPKYQSHKIVHALQIERVEKDTEIASREGRETDGSAWIYPVDEGFAPFKVDHAYVRKHDPQAGGYFVVYPDGYQSWSPKEAFESGYSPL